MVHPQGPTTEDINEMRRLRAILNGNSITESHSPELLSSKSQSSNTNPDVAVMADILKKFNSVSNRVAGQIVEESQSNPRLQEALETRITETGVIIGKWEVVCNLVESVSGKRKIYDVRNSNSGQTAFEGLSIVEAAHAIIRYLNKGYTIADPKIKEVIDLEETYNRNRIDASRFKQRYQRCIELKEKQAAYIFADRFQVARANALVAQDQIKSILESIR